MLKPLQHHWRALCGAAVLLAAAGTWPRKVWCMLWLITGLLVAVQPAQAQIIAANIVSTSVAKPSTSSSGGGQFLTDFGSSLACEYLSYQITNGATPQADIWVKWRVTSGSNLYLGGGDSGIAHPGAFAANQTKAVFFYICATATTNVYQEHVLDIYNNDPAFGTLLLTSNTMGFRTFGGDNRAYLLPDGGHGCAAAHSHALLHHPERQIRARFGVQIGRAHV